MENNINNERKEINNAPKKKKWTKKRIIFIVGIALAFVAIIILICTNSTAPQKVKFIIVGEFDTKIPSILIDDKMDDDIEKSLSLISSLEKDHYELEWYYNKEGTGDPIDLNNTLFREATTFYGIWKAKKYTITYKYGDGKLDGEKKNPTCYYIDHELTDAEKANGEVILSKETILFEPVLEGKTFKGWGITSDNSDEKFNNGNPILTADLKKIIADLLENPVGNITIEAIWN